MIVLIVLTSVDNMEKSRLIQESMTLRQMRYQQGRINSSSFRRYIYNY